MSRFLWFLKDFLSLHFKVILEMFDLGGGMRSLKALAFYMKWQITLAVVWVCIIHENKKPLRKSWGISEIK